ncbi:UNVERIFIED_CONTAM: hypothetical protein Sradi_5418900 [Sesamum radiatum]|uniref:Uncharacterized protein n=1 Tax=Sesamum radiatum TaxID=300843 RepID=A0AAW2L7T4_SESRA
MSEKLIEESAPSILDWETATSKVKGKGIGRWRRKKDGGESAAASALNTLGAPLGEGK